MKKLILGLSLGLSLLSVAGCDPQADLPDCAPNTVYQADQCGGPYSGEVVCLGPGGGQGPVGCRLHLFHNADQPYEATCVLSCSPAACDSK